ncbi:zinc finger protein OZF-like [Penaeus indicus]|uniref:zinc finger protein OZF-like n=1 Tax=Penaeus indicus TaxID=29960 RepID=UPI00300DB140
MVTCDGIELPDGEKMKGVNEEGYKYLGIQECHFSYEYLGSSCDEIWGWDSEVDERGTGETRQTRKIMAMNGALPPKSDIDRLATMSFLANRMLLAPLTGEETFGKGVIIKGEFNDDVTEETCLGIKEEPFYHGDEARDGVSNVERKHGCFNLHNLHGNRHQTYAKDSCGLVQNSNDLMLRDAFVAEDCGNKFSPDGDQAMRKESLEEELSYAFSQKGNLVRHMKVHKKENPYNCENFNKVISEKSHILQKEKVKSFSCDICNKTFSRKAHLVSHMRVHTKEKPYNCDICNKAFASKSDIIRHIRIHTKEKPYRCDICNKAFSQKTSLVNHIRLHTKEKPYSCDICNEAFSQKNRLVSHMREHTKHML